MNKQTKPLITIVTVTFNMGQHLESTIQSVLNQTYENIDYIIIDGNSSDNTVDIIKKYQSPADASKYFYTRNGGAAAYRRRGLS